MRPAFEGLIRSAELWHGGSEAGGAEVVDRSGGARQGVKVVITREGDGLVAMPENQDEQI